MPNDCFSCLHSDFSINKLGKKTVRCHHPHIEDVQIPNPTINCPHWNIKDELDKKALKNRIRRLEEKLK